MPHFSLIIFVLLLGWARAYTSTSSDCTLRPTLRCLRTRGRLVTQPVSLKRFTTFKMVCRVVCGVQENVHDTALQLILPYAHIHHKLTASRNTR
ncbi:hypothetical protein AVEN_186176-1 [Araneus ventricosus]|uniref:Secreted protein n=1 Tax=Araneus ventricosus TaxID=182803 RepID=A0A4Y2GGH4_ARAVE|nr:hypothetical protein AVEN_186176-1 [Araneus ventricosus]